MENRASGDLFSCNQRLMSANAYAKVRSMPPCGMRPPRRPWGPVRRGFVMDTLKADKCGPSTATAKACSVCPSTVRYSRFIKTARHRAHSSPRFDRGYILRANPGEILGRAFEILIVDPSYQQQSHHRAQTYPEVPRIA